MLLANKHLTPVVGIDIHVVIIPPGVPVPIPHPYIGLVIDPMDYVPIIGSTVKVNGLPRGNTGTGGFLCIFFHIPMGGPFALAPMIGHDSVNFFGSQTVKVEDFLFSPAGYMLMTCNDIGIPLTLSPGKKMKPIPSLYLPTSMTIPIPIGKPVMVGGPYIPDIMGMLKALVMSYAFGSILKGVGKGLKKGLTKLNHAIPKNKFTKGLKGALCKKGFEPVDLVTGRMIYEGVDFELPGPIPLSWERSWYSDSSYEGPMGHGWHHCYDLSLHAYEETESIMLILPDGRPAAFPLLRNKGDAFYHRPEKLTLTNTGNGQYTLFNHEERLTYTFEHQEKQACFKPVVLSNEAGHQITFSYTPAGHLQQIIDSAGRIINITLDHFQRITQITASHREEQKTLVTYAYNDAGDLTAIGDALEKQTHMRYQNHLMVEKTDRNGQTFYWEYDGPTTGARCIHTWGDGGLLEGWITYKKGHNIVTNSLGKESIYYFDENNLCTQVTDPLGNSIYHEYTDSMELFRDIDEEGNLTGYTYDDRGNLTTIELPDGSTTLFLYDDEDRLILTKPPTGGSEIRTYKNGQLMAIVGSDRGVTYLEYNHLGLVEKIRNDAGEYTRLYYDEDYNLTKIMLPNKAASEWEYDAWGQCLCAINPEKQTQHFRYDALGRVIGINTQDNNQLRFTYNAYEEITEVKDRQQHVRFNYTPLGSLKMREQNGVKVHFDYNTEEQLQKITNEQGEYYRFTRNDKGDIVKEQGFDGITRRYDRDRAGKVIKVNRPGNRYSEYEYDLAGRIARVEYNDGTWETYTYNTNGQLIEAINPNSEVYIIRDDAGRVIKETQDNHTVESSYGKLGLRKTITSSLGASINLEHTVLGEVSKLQAQVNKGKTWEAGYGYNSVGMETERILPGGIKSSWQYDAAGRPLQHTVNRGGEHTRKRTYTWNVNDRLKKMVNHLTRGTVTYDHDDFGNLAWAQYENGSYDYKLPDEVGNLYRTKDKKDRKYGPGSKLLKDGENNFRYDPEGNLISKETPNGTWNYQWYGNGMLQSITKPSQETVCFEYDALGRRTAKITAGKIKRWVWDGNVPLHEWEYQEEERPQMVVDELGFLSKDKEEPIQNLITWIFDEGTFRPAAKIADGEQYSIITDYLGTPVEMYNSKGEKTWEAEYDIYGKVRKLATGSLEDCPFRYQGQYEDAETGLYYNRFRYYAPDEGVYISQDPIRLQGNNPNIYAYVRDSNILIDSLGLHWAKGIFTDVDGNEYDLGHHEAKGKVHSEPQILDQLKKTVPEDKIAGGTLKITSLGPNKDGSVGYRFGRRANGSTFRYPAAGLPPCGPRSMNCDQLLEVESKKLKIDINYDWTDVEGVGHSKSFKGTCH